MARILCQLLPSWVHTNISNVLQSFPPGSWHVLRGTAVVVFKQCVYSHISLQARSKRSFKMGYVTSSAFESSDSFISLII